MTGKKEVGDKNCFIHSTSSNKIYFIASIISIARFYTKFNDNLLLTILMAFKIHFDVS